MTGAAFGLPIIEKPNAHILPIIEKPNAHILPIIEKPNAHILPIIEKSNAHVTLHSLKFCVHKKTTGSFFSILEDFKFFLCLYFSHQVSQ